MDSIKINTLKQLGLIVHPISKGTRYFNLSAMNVSLLIDLETKKFNTFYSFSLVEFSEIQKLQIKYRYFE